MIHLDPSRREEAIEAGWAAYSLRTPGMREWYDEACNGWQVVAVVDGQSVIGALFAKDGVIHVGIAPEYHRKWASRRIIREMLKYGTKTVLTDNEPECEEFISRIGFKKRGSAWVHEGAICHS